MGQDIDGEAIGDFSGISVSLSNCGSRLVIGAALNDGDTGDQIDDRGHARVYEWRCSRWIRLGTDIDGEARDDRSGFSVSLSRDGARLAVGGVRNDGDTGDQNDNRGHTRVYNWNRLTGTWIQIGDCLLYTSRCV